MGIAVKKTMVYVLLDRSGSMSGQETDVVGSINTFIDEQLKLPDPAVIAIASFSSEIQNMLQFIRPMGDLKEVKRLTQDDYTPCGGTPLLDATGKSIMALDQDWKREQPDRCIFVTFTDGQENASHEFNHAKIKTLIQAREKSGLWNFLFLGANIDSYSVGSSMGYTSNKMSNYVGTGVGTRSATHRMSGTVSDLRGYSDAAFAASAAGNADIGMGNNIAEDGTTSGSVNQAKATAAPNVQAPPAYQSPPPGTPPAAAMQQESWTPPTSSALFDPKVDAWKPPV